MGLATPIVQGDPCVLHRAFGRVRIPVEGSPIAILQAEVNSLYHIYDNYSGKGQPFLMELIGTRVKQLELAEVHELDDDVVEASVGMYDSLMDDYRAKQEELNILRSELKQRDKDAYQHRLNQLKDREEELQQRENQLQQRESHITEEVPTVTSTCDQRA